jgi:hypothetical protein
VSGVCVVSRLGRSDAVICDPEESGEKVTDDLLVAQVGIDLACFAGLVEEVLDLCSPLTRGPFVAFGEAGVGECFLPERDDQTASSRLVASSGRISRQHDRSAAGLVRCGRRRPTAGPPWWRGTRTAALIVAASQPSRTIVRHVASMSLIRRS